jgi:hypothetical protein
MPQHAFPTWSKTSLLGLGAILLGTLTLWALILAREKCTFIGAQLAAERKLTHHRLGNCYLAFLSGRL